MKENKSVQDVLKKTNLDWTVKTDTIQTTGGIEIDSHKAIVRQDNHKVLSIRGNDYEIYQNEQLVELLYRVSQNVGLEIVNGNYFGDGQKVYIQLKSNDLKLGNDRIEGYLTGINSFDGSTSLAFGPSNITISCQNTFFAAFRGLNTKIRHTKNMIVRVDDVCKSLENVLEEEKIMFDNIKKLSEVKISKKIQDQVLRDLFNIDKAINLNDVDSISSMTQNKMSRFYVDLDGELKGKGDNLWGLFSGVTKYTTHSISNGDNTEKKMFGTYGNRERVIFDKLVELV